MPRREYAQSAGEAKAVIALAVATLSSYDHPGSSHDAREAGLGTARLAPIPENETYFSEGLQVKDSVTTIHRRAATGTGLIVCMLVSACAGPSDATGDSAAQLNGKAEPAIAAGALAHYQKGEWAQAVRDAVQAVLLDPSDANAFVTLGASLTELHQYGSALKGLDQAIRLKPTLADAYLNRGAVYENIGDFDQALQDYDQTLQLKPDYAYAFEYRGNVYADRGQFDRAVQDYDAAIRLDSRVADFYAARGVASAELG